MTLAVSAPRHTADSLAWIPGPGFIEALPVTAWIRPLRGEFEVIVLTYSDEEGGQPALASGVLSDTVIRLADYWMTSPSELRLLVDAGLLTMTDLGPAHPAVAYAEAYVGQLGGDIRPESWTALGITPARDVETASGEFTPHFDEVDLPF
ncbi:MAG TPA: hypothetical protein VGL46_17665 [Pseudonocardiaceae bacterium]|jgi:hypothetical protein